jgi:hypothetical protein
MQRVCLPASYLVFSIKEIFDYLNEQTEKGESVYSMRKNFKELKNLKEEEKRITDSLF